jgi:hypothetical protein
MISLKNTKNVKEKVPEIGYRRLPVVKKDGISAAGESASVPTLGKMARLRAGEPAPVLTLGEMARLRVGEQYDIFECAFYAWKERKNAACEYDGEYSILLSLLNPSSVIEISGTIRSQNNDVLHNIPVKKFTNTSVVKLRETFQADESIDQDTLVLTVKAEYSSGGRMQHVEQTVPLTYSNLGNFVYTKHAHPSRRESHNSPIPDDRKYGGSSDRFTNDVFSTDENYVHIALFRRPANTNDIDYICDYTDNSGKTILGVPGEGTLIYKGTGAFISCDATCLLHRQSGGAVIMGTAAYETDAACGDVTIIKVEQEGNQFTYRMPPDRKRADEYWRKHGKTQYYTDFSGWTVTPFDYEMKLVFNFEGSPPKTVLITSDETRRTSDLNTDIFTVDVAGNKVLPLKIAGGCLAPGAQITTRNGSVPIESVKIGDFVKCPQAPGGWAEVRNVWSGTERGEMALINASGQTLLMTKNHPVYIRTGYKRACELGKSDEVSIEGREFATVTVKIVPYDGKVYNIDTGGDYGFVANGIVVGTNSTQNKN